MTAFSLVILGKLFFRVFCFLFFVVVVVVAVVASLRLNPASPLSF